jgi:xanthine dehydrogenase accessory factor
VNHNAHDLDRFLAKLATQSACLVSVHSTRGSVPREQGAWMAVFDDEVIGTVGGGQLEFQAIAQAHGQLNEALIEQVLPDEPVRYALGPNLGQCCGGEVHLKFELVRQDDVDNLRKRLSVALRPVALFGGGHVGKALVEVLVNLPFEVRWVDSRDEIFPFGLPAQVHCEHSDPVQGAVAALDAGSQVLIMSFSHAEDLDVVAACLQRQRTRGDLPFIGLIGSKTKWARFRHQLEARGFTPKELSQVTCPIGVEGIASKLPEVIAVAVAAQLLLELQRDSSGTKSVYTEY